MRDLAAFHKEYSSKAESEIETRVKRHGQEIVIGWTTERFDTGFICHSEIVVSSLDLDEALGAWAKRAKDAGVMDKHVGTMMEDYKIRDESHDGDGTLYKYNTYIILKPAAAILAQYIDRATTQTT